MPENKIPTMVAIALAESGGDSGAHNPDASTGDNSYGLWQINMLGDLGPDRRQKFGIESNEELFDPVTNAKAAKYVLEKGGGLTAWSTYKGEGKGRYAEFLESANKAYQTTKAEPAKPKPAAATTSSTNTTGSPETQSSVEPQEPTIPPTEPSQEVSETSAKSNETQVAVKEGEMEPKVLQANNTSATPPVIVIPGQQGTRTAASQPSRQLSEDLAFFSSTNPENLYMFSNLRELNLV